MLDGKERAEAMAQVVSFSNCLVKHKWAFGYVLSPTYLTLTNLRRKRITNPPRLLYTGLNRRRYRIRSTHRVLLLRFLPLRLDLRLFLLRLLLLRLRLRRRLLFRLRNLRLLVYLLRYLRRVARFFHTRL